MRNYNTSSPLPHRMPCHRYSLSHTRVFSDKTIGRLMVLTGNIPPPRQGPKGNGVATVAPIQVRKILLQSPHLQTSCPSSLSTKIVPTDTLPREVAFLMGDIPDWEVLAASLGTAIEVIRIDASCRWTGADSPVGGRTTATKRSGFSRMAVTEHPPGRADAAGWQHRRARACSATHWRGARRTVNVLLYGCDVAQDSVGRPSNT